jgi:hypothetical protein
MQRDAAAESTAFPRARLAEATPGRTRPAVGFSVARYLNVYVSCRPTMLTSFLYEPLIRPLAAVLPAF